MALYRALTKGFDGFIIREKGEEFEFSGKPGKWMEPLDEKPEEKPAPQPKARKRQVKV